jgi:hypothetical protein
MVDNLRRSTSFGRGLFDTQMRRLEGRTPRSPQSLTRAASRHRMVANGIQCRFVAFVIVSACDDRGFHFSGVEFSSQRRERPRSIHRACRRHGRAHDVDPWATARCTLLV